MNKDIKDPGWFMPKGFTKEAESTRFLLIQKKLVTRYLERLSSTSGNIFIKKNMKTIKDIYDRVITNIKIIKR